MNKILILGLFCFVHYCVFAQTPANDPHWQLKWEDNFNVLDANIWNVADHTDGKGENFSVDIASNVYISNNMLICRAKKEYYCCPSNSLNEYGCYTQWEEGTCYQYTSGSVTTQSNYKTEYGYIEARIKMTFRKGVAYAFWTYGRGIHSNGYSEGDSEIDIFETIVPSMTQATNNLSLCTHTCYDTPLHEPGCEKIGGLIYTLPNFDYTDWYVYAIEWDPGKIIWYLDGKAVRTLQNKDLDNFGHNIKDPMSIILGCNVQPKYLTSTVSFSECMYVDYVKVYQLKCDKNTPLTINNLTDLANYDNRVKKSITINPITIPAGNSIFLRANDFIELKPGFEVQTGRELYLDVSPCEVPNSVKPPDLRENN